MSIKRKFKKLLRDPRLFFLDMRLKYRKHLKYVVPFKKYDGQNKFTVVSAVYGVEKYLEDYFVSLINQRLDFRKHIHLIMIDDGSKDDSAEIIKKWQKKFPDNITYVYKDNGGQASARNLGLEYVRTKWVTFIDPDDFVDLDYFLEVNNYLETTKDNVGFISCNLIFYLEKSKKYQNSHPLKYKFENNNITTLCSDLEGNVQMSSSSAIFLTDVIHNNNILFDERIQPSFEDASLISYYLYYVDEKSKALFLERPKYFYRKREDNTSTLDGSWSNKKKFRDVFIYGYHPILEFYNNNNQKVPIHIQRQVLYDLVWYLKYLINNPSNLSILSTEEISDFHQLFAQTFEYIDEKTILNFNLAGVWFYHKVLMLIGFKTDLSFKQIVYIEKVDLKKKLVLMSYIDKESSALSINSGDDYVSPVFYKKIPQEFANETLGCMHYFWVRMDSLSDKFSISINGKISRISLHGKHYSNEINVSDIVSAFSESEDVEDIWVFMDRDVQADDNAEHLYRYVKRIDPSRGIYFALRKSSHDWNRLEKEGFNLLDFGTKEHEIILRKCSKIISSHADRYVHNYFSDNSLMKKKFVFLQHGVTKDDMSAWFNQKKNMDLLITATKPEFQSIVNNKSSYIFSEKEVKLTGFPRYDKLWEKRNTISNNRVILLMPTWRQSIVGSVVGEGNTRNKNNSFENSSYFKHWKSVLHSKTLHELVNKYNYRIIFAPHKNVEIYMNSFNIPDYIECWKATPTESMQDLFLKSSFMITDYSSVAFEMAYLNKTTIYYQFDEIEVFSGNHIYQKGYFDYKKDGFGPKVLKEEDLLYEIEKLCKANGVIEDKYLQRIKNTFVYQDSSNCKRVYEAICDLDKRGNDSSIDIDILEELCSRSLSNGCLSDTISYYKQLLIFGDKSRKSIAYSRLLRLYYACQEFVKIDDLLQQHYAYNLDSSYRIEGLLFAMREDWDSSIDMLSRIVVKQSNDILSLMKICAYSHNKEFFFMTLELIEHDEKLKKLKPLFENYLANDWHEVIYILSKLLIDSDFCDVETYKLQLILSRAYRKLGLLGKSSKALHDYERFIQDDHECRIEIAYLAYENKKYKKVISQVRQVFKDNWEYMPSRLLAIFSKSLYFIGNQKDHILTLDFLKKNYPVDINTIELVLFVSRVNGAWEDILLYEKDILRNPSLIEYKLYLLLSYERISGKTEALKYGQSIEREIVIGDKQLYYKVMSALAFSDGNWNAAEEYYSKLLTHTPDSRDQQEVWLKLLGSQVLMKNKERDIKDNNE